MEPDRSVYMYRAGEAKIFAPPEEIPSGEGWQDTPVPDVQAQPEEPAPKRKKITLPPPEEPAQ